MSDDSTTLQDVEDEQDEKDAPEPKAEEVAPIRAPEKDAAAPAPVAQPSATEPAPPPRVVGTPAPAAEVQPNFTTPPSRLPTQNETPGQQALSGMSDVQRQNPFSVLFAKEKDIHNTPLRVLAKVGTALGAGAEGMSKDYPAIQAGRERAATNEEEAPVKAAQARDIRSQADVRDKQANAPAPIKLPKPIGEPVSDGKGGFVQASQDPSTGAESFQPVSGVPEPAGAPGPPPRVASPVAQGGGGAPIPIQPAQPPAFGTKLGEKPEKAAAPEKPSEFKPYTVDGKEVLGQQVGNKVVDAGGNDITAKALPYSKPEPDRGAEAEARKDAHTMGYAAGPDGKVIYTSQADAKKQGMTFEEMKPADVKADRQSIRQLNDVQTNISRYRDATDAIKENISPLASQTMAAILSDKGLGVKVEPFGIGLDLGQLNDVITNTEKAGDWNKLKPEEQDAVLSYLRAKSSIIAYNKVLSGSARASEKQLEIEMQQLPLPYVGGTVADKQLNAFQENIDRASDGFPTNLPGLKAPGQVRQEIEGGKPGQVPQGATAGTMNGKHGYVLNGQFHGE
jgi:hypothetical protein